MTISVFAQMREKKRARDKARNEALPDAIVLRGLIRGTRLVREDIPLGLITLKRTQILIHRELKQLNAAIEDAK